ncbi:MAG TPA: DUF4058 family protein [Gemmataceae bacterium]|nr:DUF4058 family protein [Gemmataceae bacterium]
MPLHDWTDRSGWEGVHHLWITELLRWIKPRLPAGYRAYIGSAPTVAIGAPLERPDVGVRQWPENQIATDNPASHQSEPEHCAQLEPDEEIAVAMLDPGISLYVEIQGRLAAAVELVSPRNKDCPVARTTYLARYLAYLIEGVHLLLVDVHRRPLGFSFADQISQELQIRQESCPPPMAVSYRVGEKAATGGRLLARWRRPLVVGSPLPAMLLPITLDVSISIDLVQTYSRAAEDAYLT